MDLFRGRFGVSERRACQVVGQHRSTQRLVPPELTDEEERLRRWLRSFSKSRLRWGWRQDYKGLRRQGWWVNKKRVQRIWREEGLRVPHRGKKRPLRGIGVAVGTFCPIRPNVLWALDFQFDQTADGRNLKLLNSVDEFTSECPDILVARNIDADEVVNFLDKIALGRGAPAFLRFDHGPEFVAEAVADWCRANGAATVFIDRRGLGPRRFRYERVHARQRGPVIGATP